MCFFNSGEKGYLEQKMPISTWKNLSCRKYYLQRLTQFTQGHNVLDAAASNTDGVLEEIHVFLQLSCIALYGRTRA
jgi:hypothetical protein